MRCRLWSIALAGAVAFCAPPAAAEAPPRTSSLGWVRLPGAEACIDMRELAIARGFAGSTQIARVYSLDLATGTSTQATISPDPQYFLAKP